MKDRITLSIDDQQKIKWEGENLLLITTWSISFGALIIGSMLMALLYRNYPLSPDHFWWWAMGSALLALYCVWSGKKIRQKWELFLIQQGWDGSSPYEVKSRTR